MKEKERGEVFMGVLAAGSVGEPLFRSTNAKDKTLG